jgi:hypothetical protein
MQKVINTCKSPMKNLSFLLLFVLACTQLEAQPSIPKNANTIVISDTFQQSRKYNEITEILFENGIGTSYADKEMGQITTTPVSFKNGNFILLLSIKDTLTTIRGQWSWNMKVNSRGVMYDFSEYDDIKYKGMKNSPVRNAWEAMQKIIDQIPGEKSYIIK